MAYFDISRNENCICGSGKKFKKCCMATLEMLARRFNNNGRWYWLEPKLSLFIAMACGLPYREGEYVPSVAEMEEALDYISETVYVDEGKDEQIDNIYDLLGIFEGLLRQEEKFKMMLLPEEVMDKFADLVNKKFDNHKEKPSSDKIIEVIEDVSEDILAQYVDEERSAELYVMISHALRFRQYTKEERAALVFAIFTCLIDSGINPVWDQIFRASIALELEKGGDESIEDFPDPSWPIVKAFVPDREIMRICGIGSAGFVRQQPDGLLSITFFIMNPLEGGISEIFTKNNLNVKELDELMNMFQRNLPPWHEGSSEIASLCIWGFYYLFHDMKNVSEDWLDEMKLYLSLVPAPKGNRQKWKTEITASGGYILPDFIDFIKNRDIPPDIPEGKEIMTYTTVTYAVWEPDKIAEVLMSCEPEFSVETSKQNKKWQFSWTREYPIGHDSPAAKLGGRQVLVNGSISKDKLVIEGTTLSMTAHACQRLLELAGNNLTFIGVKWLDPLELFMNNQKRRIKKGKSK